MKRELTALGSALTLMLVATISCVTPKSPAQQALDSALAGATKVELSAPGNAVFKTLDQAKTKALVAKLAVTGGSDPHCKCLGTLRLTFHFKAAEKRKPVTLAYHHGTHLDGPMWSGQAPITEGTKAALAPLAKAAQKAAGLAEKMRAELEARRRQELERKKLEEQRAKERETKPTGAAPAPGPGPGAAARPIPMPGSQSKADAAAKLAKALKGVIRIALSPPMGRVFRTLTDAEEITRLCAAIQLAGGTKGRCRCLGELWLELSYKDGKRKPITLQFHHGQALTGGPLTGNTPLTKSAAMRLQALADAIPAKK